jgi:hypothetical protein
LDCAKAEENDEKFPFKEAVSWVSYWERIGEYGEEMLQSNPTLALHIVQQYTGAKTHYKSNAPEVDHIFPRSVLRGDIN